MFLALRDMLAARGRFGLMATTVAMMALLVSFLSGLTGGLTHQSTSALQSLGGGTAYLQSSPTTPSFDQSRISAADTEQLLAGAPATAAAASMARIDATTVTVVATRPGPHGPAAAMTPTPAAGHSVFSAAAARKVGVRAGDTVMLRGQEFVVDAVTGDAWLNHAHVVFTHLARVADATVVVTATPVPVTPAQVTELPARDLANTIAAHRAESTSLTLINVMLMVIAALVVGAFFLVWTVQRTPDIATLKALGATGWALALDLLGQAAVILTVGITLGVGVTIAAGALLPAGIPLALGVKHTLYPGLILLVVGLAGAATSLGLVRRTTALLALRAR